MVPALQSEENAAPPVLGLAMAFQERQQGGQPHEIFIVAHGQQLNNDATNMVSRRLWIYSHSNIRTLRNKN